MSIMADFSCLYYMTCLRSISERLDISNIIYQFVENK